MPKNKGKGGKNRRRGKNENEGLKRELVFKEDGQEYAQVRYSSIYNMVSLRLFRSLKCLGTGGWKPCASTGSSDSVTSGGSCVRKFGSTSRISSL